MSIETNLVGTNIELFGSDLEINIKKASANNENEWNKIKIDEPSLYIWRVEKFKLVTVKPEDFGSFYEGDSYIILCISLNSMKLLNYNVHFWIGDKTSTDELGTAAYKTVELDTYLEGKAVQHREIQNNESDLFRSYFSQGLSYKIGGVDSGFKKVVPYTYDNYRPILFKVHNDLVIQIPVDLSLVNDDDSFILDMGLTVYVYRGIKSTHKEGLLAQYHAQHIKNNRKNCFVFNLIANEDKYSYDSFTHLLLNYSNGSSGIKKLMRITETDSDITMTELSNPVTYNSLNTNDTFIFETLHTTYIWVGKNSNHKELMAAWSLAFKITDNTTPITLVKEGYESEQFLTSF